MQRTALLLALAIAAAASPALAQTASQREEGDKACNRDVSRFCRPVIDQGDYAILSCLQQNANKISRPCRKFLEDNGQL
jgi:hypothetical protein